MIISSFPVALGEWDTGAALCKSVIHALTGSGPGKYRNPDLRITSTQEDIWKQLWLADSRPELPPYNPAWGCSAVDMNQAAGITASQSVVTPGSRANPLLDNLVSTNKNTRDVKNSPDGGNLTERSSAESRI